jgi:hypothetical protein
VTNSTRIASLLMLVLFAGCGDDTTSATTQDLATGADMGVPADLKQLSCANVLACIAGCGQNLACAAACTQDGTTAARATFNAFAGCVAATCGPVDGGSDACTSPTDSSAGCQTCLSNTSANALNARAPCNAEYAACAGS